MAQQTSAMRANITSLSPGPTQEVDIREPMDTSPSDIQPPGVDEEWEPQSLEEALLGE